MKYVEVKQSEGLRTLARAFGYRKHKVFLVDSDTVELTGTFWSGGSRASYALYTPANPNPISSIAYSTDPYPYGGPRVAPVFKIPSGSYVVEGGIFCGKKATFTITGADAVWRFGPIDRSEMIRQAKTFDSECKRMRATLQSDRKRFGSGRRFE